MISISHPTGHLQGQVHLPSSKSISNRMLILKALYAEDKELVNLSEANDTILLQRILNSDAKKVDVEDAGTAMRFLVAYYAATAKEVKLFGQQRMHKRPIAELVDALKQLGADIEYLQEEGYPPLRIKASSLQEGVVDMTNVRSSQFISAVLMILPLHPEIKLKVNSSMNSWMFVDLTIQLMRQMGLNIHLDKGVLRYAGGKPSIENYAVEADWTSFYYWYAAACMSISADIFFPKLKIQSIQAESSCYPWFNNSTIELIEENGGVRLIKSTNSTIASNKINLNQFPDLAPTFALLYACQKVNACFEGLDSLVYKESDRDEAIKEQLACVGVNWTKKDDLWILDPRGFQLSKGQKFKVFSDHRMAMSLLPLALIEEIGIAEPEVVRKSYPGFWEDCKNLGFKITDSSR